MRRGGRGSNLQALWRGLDDAIPSSLHLERGWPMGNFVKVVVLAACSIAISILIWRLELGRPPGSHHNLGSRNPGFVFPLYQYFQQYANGSHVVGRRKRWRGSRVGNGRRIRSDELNPMFKLRVGHRSRDDRDTELGDPPKPFYFHTDTGSGSPWVHSTIPEYESSIADFGPNGRFVSKEKSIVKCIGSTESLCRACQSKVVWNEEDNYECMFSALYGDDSYYEDLVVTESLTVPMQDITERTVFALFGCVLHEESRSEELPLLTDGVVGLGKCEGSHVDQLSTSKAIMQKVPGVCLAKEIRGSMLRPSGRAGYISLGKDLEKFDQSKSVWAKLVGPKMDCYYAANLLFISVGNIRITVWFESLDLENAGMALGFDTGTDLAFLRKDVYDQVLNALDSFTSYGDYFRLRDDENYVLSEQRLCWHYHGNKRKRGVNHLGKASSIDFPALKFEFEGIAATEIPELQHILQYLVVQPENYPTWDADRGKLYVKILPENNVPGMPYIEGEWPLFLDCEYNYCWTESKTKRNFRNFLNLPLCVQFLPYTMV